MANFNPVSWIEKLFPPVMFATPAPIQRETHRRCPDCFAAYEPARHRYCPQCHSAVPEWRYG